VSVGLVDTTILCNILDVPGYNQDRGLVLTVFLKLVDGGVTLLLPMATIFETGNHVAGSGRYDVAERFASMVERSLDGLAPWTPTQFVRPEELRSWLPDFPKRAVEKMSLVDLSLIHEFHRQCVLNQARRVFIWSLDQHLVGFDRAAVV
jgi:hypothetical protein